MWRSLVVALSALLLTGAVADAEPRGFKPAGEVELEPKRGDEAHGRMKLFESKDGELAFNLTASGLDHTRPREAYAVWLIGGGRSRFLGFAPSVSRNGRLATSGPLESDADRFPKWFARAHRVLLTVEMGAKVKRPGDVVLRGSLRGS